MEEGQIIGLVITIVAVVALAAGLIWLFTTGTKPKWPEGRRLSANGFGYQAVVVWGDGLMSDPLLAPSVARAAWALSAAWMKFKKRDAGFETVAVHVLGEDEFDQRVRDAMVVGPDGDPKRINAFAGRVWQRLGSGPPLCVMRASLVPHAINTGQPIIHELLHSIDGLYHDRKHETPHVWDMSDTETSVEAHATKLYRRELAPEAPVE